MKTVHIILPAFVIISLIQLTAPISMIVQKEMTIKYGKMYKFRAAAADPYDPFRGRYVTINLISSEAKKPAGRIFKTHQSVPVSLTTSEDGFTSYGEILLAPPEDNSDWMWANVNYSGGETVMLRPPFDRYYMNEFDAPAAEVLYNQSVWGRRRVAVWVEARIRNGDAVLERLMIDGKPIEELLNKTEISETPPIGSLDEM